MFTGIIESLGTVKVIEHNDSNIDFTIESPISDALKVDQSISHNGVCLTVVQVGENQHKVTAVAETLNKSNIGKLAVGSVVNLERCMVANDRLDGHIVQGHVDQTAICTKVKKLDGSWQFDFKYDIKTENITVEKGAISINGVSLTCFNSTEDTFSVTIIPYTIEHTNFNLLKYGDTVNLEFDIIGKYVSKFLKAQ